MSCGQSAKIRTSMVMVMSAKQQLDFCCSKRPSSSGDPLPFLQPFPSPSFHSPHSLFCPAHSTSVHSTPLHPTYTHKHSHNNKQTHNNDKPLLTRSKMRFAPLALLLPMGHFWVSSVDGSLFSSSSSSSTSASTDVAPSCGPSYSPCPVSYPCCNGKSRSFLFSA